MRLSIEGARVADARGEGIGRRVAFDDEMMIDPLATHEADAAHIDAGGFVVLPGFVDVHTHGGGGFALHTRSPDEIRRYASWAASTGVTAFLAGVVGVRDGLPEAELAAVARAADAPGLGAQLLGTHLEGPFLNPARRGAHDPGWLRAPNPDAVERLLGAARGRLRIVTLAPELPDAADAIARFTAAGVVVSVGHTEANYEQTVAAFRLGARHVTHCFNAMPPLLHRSPGPLGAIADTPDVLGEMIADGVHVHPAALRALLHLLGPERTVVVTDAQSGAGLDDPTMTFGGMTARVVGGVARLADGTIAGSVLTMDQALRNVVEMLRADLQHASAMLSWNPARAAGVGGRKGLLAPGFDADLVVLDPDLRVIATYCRGQLAYAAPAWLERLQAAGIES